MFSNDVMRFTPTVALALIFVVSASGVQARSPSLAQYACMARDLPAIRASNLPVAQICALHSASGRARAGRNNTAQVQQSGDNNRAEIHQRGSGHNANLSQEGGNSSQLIFQFGRGTQADIHQTRGQSGVLIQFGW
ncbi:curlin repeat-containing protein [Roseinatronobacter sp.]|uniref:curlin repeat-containing protein n=1 Tax=Roseinatronobacter sp. TaxID=1945755 RepID=UPI0025E040F9|nr:curlin repeat-containing protein [Rhodobaca sp.]